VDKRVSAAVAQAVTQSSASIRITTNGKRGCLRVLDTEHERSYQVQRHNILGTLTSRADSHIDPGDQCTCCLLPCCALSPPSRCSCN
jgi:hypothetical protein